MVITSPAVLRLVALLVVAPIGAAVVISALLLSGIDPQRVFLPGLFVMSRLQDLGFHVANPVGVVSTFVFWWAIIVSAWLALRRFRRPA